MFLNVKRYLEFQDYKISGFSRQYKCNYLIINKLHLTPLHFKHTNPTARRMAIPLPYLLSVVIAVLYCCVFWLSKGLNRKFPVGDLCRQIFYRLPGEHIHQTLPVYQGLVV